MAEITKDKSINERKIIENSSIKSMIYRVTIIKLILKNFLVIDIVSKISLY